MAGPLLRDAVDRPLGNLRISVTDRCNLRCLYCMPERDYVWLPRADILDFEEIAQLAVIFADLGVDRVRLTGGEPLVRRNLPELVRLLAGNARLRDIALTTNGVRLAGEAGALKAAGLRRVTVSLDTLHADRFERLTRARAFERVIEGIREAARTDLSPLKIDTVVIRGVNDDELIPLLEFGKSVGAEVRFIEYMDVGGATGWSMEQVIPRSEMLGRLARHYGPIEPLPAEGRAPAERYRLADGTVFGIIASTTAPFCRACDRSRLTADGLWYLCLYGTRGVNLRDPLRGGATPEELRQNIREQWQVRADRGAEERLLLRRRDPLLGVAALKNDPHLEMHTRGG
jgi:GTP 3',8-cyclase